MNTNEKRTKTVFKNERRFLLSAFTMMVKAYGMASFVMLLFKFRNLCHVKVKRADLALKKIKSSQIGKKIA